MKKSFTLIELLVVVTVMMIFLGLVLTRYNTNTEQVKLRSEAKKLVDVIELAKKKALSADLQDKNCSNFSGYRVALTANNYSLIFCCQVSCSTPTNIQTYNFNTDIFNKKILILSGIGNLDFPPLMVGLNNSINSIRLKNSVINQCVNISVSSTGVVELNEALFSC